MKKTFLIGSFISVLFTGNSAFADEPSWSGFYGAAMLGYTFGDVEENRGTYVLYDPVNGDYHAILNGSNGDSLKGFSGTFRLGYNKELSGNNLIGVELGATFQDADAKSPISNTYDILSPYDPNRVDPNPLVDKTKVNNYQTLGLRLGHIFNQNTLVYVSGGVAYGKINRTLSQPGPDENWFSVGASDSSTSRETGYDIGLGVEHKLSDKLSVRANYEYVDFGKVKDTFNSVLDDGSTVSAVKVDQSANIDFSNLSVGLQYQF
jgi:outer membrane immunogenic protein